MSKLYGGFAADKYDTAGNNFAAAVTVDVPRESTPEINNPMAGSPQADGTNNYAGTKISIERHYEDMSKYSALETIAKDDVHIDLRVTDLEGNTTDFLDLTVAVDDTMPAETGTNQYFKAIFTGFAI